MRGRGKSGGQQPNDIRHKDKDKQGKDIREVFQTVFARDILDHFIDKGINDFCHGLATRGDKGAFARANNQQHNHGQHRQPQPECNIGRSNHI